MIHNICWFHICQRYQDYDSIFVEMVMFVIIIWIFQTLVLEAWEKEQKELEAQGLWKLVYR